MYCLNCEKELIGRQKKWCSEECRANKRNQEYFKDSKNLQDIYKQRKQRGFERKYSVIQELGGCCSKCGYKRNLAALEFHHTDPSQKEINIGSREFSNYSQERILKELDKCVLLCSNCHREEHNPQLNIFTSRQCFNLVLS